MYQRVLLPFVDKKAGQPDDEAGGCTICNLPFRTFMRRHHCRADGLVVCDACSNRRISLIHPSSLTVEKNCRVCEVCFRVAMLSAGPFTGSGAGGGGSPHAFTHSVSSAGDFSRTSAAPSPSPPRGSAAAAMMSKSPSPELSARNLLSARQSSASPSGVGGGGALSARGMSRSMASVSSSTAFPPEPVEAWQWAATEADRVFADPLVVSWEYRMSDAAGTNSSGSKWIPLAAHEIDLLAPVATRFRFFAVNRLFGDSSEFAVVDLNKHTVTFLETRKKATLVRRLRDSFVDDVLRDVQHLHLESAAAKMVQFNLLAKRSNSNNNNASPRRRSSFMHLAAEPAANADADVVSDQQRTVVRAALDALPAAVTEQPATALASTMLQEAAAQDFVKVLSSLEGLSPEGTLHLFGGDAKMLDTARRDLIRNACTAIDRVATKVASSLVTCTGTTSGSAGSRGWFAVLAAALDGLAHVRHFLPPEAAAERFLNKVRPALGGWIQARWAMAESDVLGADRNGELASYILSMTNVGGGGGEPSSGAAAASAGSGGAAAAAAAPTGVADAFSTLLNVIVRDGLSFELHRVMTHSMLLNAAPAVPAAAPQSPAAGAASGKRGVSPPQQQPALAPACAFTGEGPTSFATATAILVSALCTATRQVTKPAATPTDAHRALRALQAARSVVAEVVLAAAPPPQSSSPVIGPSAPSAAATSQDEPAAAAASGVSFLERAPSLANVSGHLTMEERVRQRGIVLKMQPLLADMDAEMRRLRAGLEARYLEFLALLEEASNADPVAASSSNGNGGSVSAKPLAACWRVFPAIASGPTAIDAARLGEAEQRLALLTSSRVEELQALVGATQQTDSAASSSSLSSAVDGLQDLERQQRLLERGAAALLLDVAESALYHAQRIAAVQQQQQSVQKRSVVIAGAAPAWKQRVTGLVARFEAALGRRLGAAAMQCALLRSVEPLMPIARRGVLYMASAAALPAPFDRLVVDAVKTCVLEVLDRELAVAAAPAAASAAADRLRHSIEYLQLCVDVRRDFLRSEFDNVAVGNNDSGNGSFCLSVTHHEALAAEQRRLVEQFWGDAASQLGRAAFQQVAQELDTALSADSGDAAGDVASSERSALFVRCVELLESPASSHQRRRAFPWPAIAADARTEQVRAVLEKLRSRRSLALLVLQMRKLSSEWVAAASSSAARASSSSSVASGVDAEAVLTTLNEVRAMIPVAADLRQQTERTCDVMAAALEQQRDSLMARAEEAVAALAAAESTDAEELGVSGDADGAVSGGSSGPKRDRRVKQAEEASRSLDGLITVVSLMKGQAGASSASSSADIRALLLKLLTPERVRQACASPAGIATLHQLLELADAAGLLLPPPSAAAEQQQQPQPTAFEFPFALIATIVVELWADVRGAVLASAPGAPSAAIRQEQQRKFVSAVERIQAFATHGWKGNAALLAAVQNGGAGFGVAAQVENMVEGRVFKQALDQLAQQCEAASLDDSDKAREGKVDAAVQAIVGTLDAFPAATTDASHLSVDTLLLSATTAAPCGAVKKRVAADVERLVARLSASGDADAIALALHKACVEIATASRGIEGDGDRAQVFAQQRAVFFDLLLAFRVPCLLHAVELNRKKQLLLQQQQQQQLQSAASGVYDDDGSGDASGTNSNNKMSAREREELIRIQREIIRGNPALVAIISSLEVEEHRERLALLQDADALLRVRFALVRRYCCLWSGPDNDGGDDDDVVTSNSGDEIQKLVAASGRLRYPAFMQSSLILSRTDVAGLNAALQSGATADVPPVQCVRVTAAQLHRVPPSSATLQRHHLMVVQTPDGQTGKSVFGRQVCLHQSFSDRLVVHLNLPALAGVDMPCSLEDLLEAAGVADLFSDANLEWMAGGALPVKRLRKQQRAAAPAAVVDGDGDDDGEQDNGSFSGAKSALPAILRSVASLGSSSSSGGPGLPGLRSCPILWVVDGLDEVLGARTGALTAPSMKFFIDHFFKPRRDSPGAARAALVGAVGGKVDEDFAALRPRDTVLVLTRGDTVPTWSLFHRPSSAAAMCGAEFWSLDFPTPGAIQSIAKQRVKRHSAALRRLELLRQRERTSTLVSGYDDDDFGADRGSVGRSDGGDSDDDGDNNNDGRNFSDRRSTVSSVRAASRVGGTGNGAGGTGSESSAATSATPLGRTGQQRPQNASNESSKTNLNSGVSDVAAAAIPLLNRGASAVRVQLNASQSSPLSNKSSPSKSRGGGGDAEDGHDIAILDSEGARFSDYKEPDWAVVVGSDDDDDGAPEELDRGEQLSRAVHVVSRFVVDEVSFAGMPLSPAIIDMAADVHVRTTAAATGGVGALNVGASASSSSAADSLLSVAPCLSEFFFGWLLIRTNILRSQGDRLEKERSKHVLHQAIVAAGRFFVETYVFANRVLPETFSVAPSSSSSPSSSPQQRWIDYFVRIGIVVPTTTSTTTTTTTTATHSAPTAYRFITAGTAFAAFFAAQYLWEKGEAAVKASQFVWSMEHRLVWIFLAHITVSMRHFTEKTARFDGNPYSLQSILPPGIAATKLTVEQLIAQIAVKFDAQYKSLKSVGHFSSPSKDAKGRDDKSGLGVVPDSPDPHLFAKIYTGCALLSTLSQILPCEELFDKIRKSHGLFGRTLRTPSFFVWLLEIAPRTGSMQTLQKLLEVVHDDDLTRSSITACIASCILARRTVAFDFLCFAQTRFHMVVSPVLACHLDSAPALRAAIEAGNIDLPMMLRCAAIGTRGGKREVAKLISEYQQKLQQSAALLQPGSPALLVRQLRGF